MAKGRALWPVAVMLVELPENIEQAIPDDRVGVHRQECRQIHHPTHGCVSCHGECPGVIEQAELVDGSKRAKAWLERIERLATIEHPCVAELPGVDEERR